MSNTNAYTIPITPVGSGIDEIDAIHQTSPSWVLTFVRWNVRDTLRAVSQTGSGTDLLSTRPPLVVENDCIQLSVNVNKSVLTHSMQATLVETDVNYETAIAPGDFVFVNILNWDQDADRIVQIASSKKTGSINGVNDGFKGIFKVQSVRKTVAIVDNSGIKQVRIKVTGFAFTEFNNSIYFNPYLLRDNVGSDKDNLLFPSNLSSDYAQLINPSTNPTCQDIIRLLIRSFIGVGVTDQGAVGVSGALITTNTHFYVPQQVGTLLGVSGVTAAKDIYNYLFGIQEYGSNPTAALSVGTNPSNIIANPASTVVTIPPTGRFYYTTNKCVGTTLLKAEYWNQVKAWSIINQYTNAPLNELYTCFRTSPEGRVMPTVVYRQTPFTSQQFGTGVFNINEKVTRFLSLPRWQISAALVLSTDLGRDEAARINFVQYYAQPPSDVGKPIAYMSAQTASRNYVYDVNDVVRSGLRPMVVTTTFEDLTINKDTLIGRKCALIVGDAVIGEHLKMNGTIECAGVVAPIAVGDNLEYEQVIYHIEEVNHVCGLDMKGDRTFRTVLRLSHGTSVVNGEIYPEMTHTRGYQDRKANYDLDKVLPGVSEEQAVWYRQNRTAPTKAEINKNDKPFVQPGQTVLNRSGGNNE